RTRRHRDQHGQAYTPDDHNTTTNTAANHPCAPPAWWYRPVSTGSGERNARAVRQPGSSERRWMAWVIGAPDRPREAEMEAKPQDGQAGGSESNPQASLAGGRLLSAISTRIVQMMREHYGRGPLKAKTYALDDIIVCVL